MKQPDYLIIHPDFTTENTSVYCEAPEERKYNAPHHFKVKNVHNLKVVGEVDFQEGPIKEVGINGVFNEDLLLMVLTRLEQFQLSECSCSENEEAINHIKQAINALRSRTNRRKNAGIEGTSNIDELNEGAK
jgi:hypothetical protein